MKHAGDAKAAAALADEARTMDLADRFLNSECVKRMLQADQVLIIRVISVNLLSGLLSTLFETARSRGHFTVYTYRFFFHNQASDLEVNEFYLDLVVGLVWSCVVLFIFCPLPLAGV